MNPTLASSKSLRAGFSIMILADVMANAFFWLIHGTKKENSEYWVRDVLLFLPSAGTVVLAICTMIMLAFLKSKTSEAKSISLLAVIAMSLPCPFAIAALLTSTAWWMAILAYLVYVGAFFGASIASVRIANIRP